MPEFDYRLVYTEQGTYLALVDEPQTQSSADFWNDFRQGVAAVIALPLTVLSFLF